MERLRDGAESRNEGALVRTGKPINGEIEALAKQKRFRSVRTLENFGIGDNS